MSEQFDSLDDFFSAGAEKSSILLYGEAGVGKTVALITALEAGKKVKLLATESNAISGAKKAFEILKDRSKPEEFQRYQANFAISIVKKSDQTLADMAKSLDRSLKMQLKDAKIKADPKRKVHTAFLNVITGMSDFVDILGNSHGSAETWGTETVFYVDGNTPIIEMIMSHVVGNKEAVGMDEWGVIQKHYKNYIRTLTEGLSCNVVLLAHPKKTKDEILGGIKLYPSAPGKALDNWLPTAFSEVIWAFQDDGKFYWSSAHKQAVTRVTLLPVKERMPADFKQLWKK